jgi:hypothetical protein
VRDSPRTELGWRIKVLWVVASRQATPVNIMVEGVGGVAPASIELEGSPRRTVVLDPKKSGRLQQPQHPRLPFLRLLPEGGLLFFRGALGGRQLANRSRCRAIAREHDEDYLPASLGRGVSSAFDGAARDVGLSWARSALGVFLN